VRQGDRGRLRSLWGDAPAPEIRSPTERATAPSTEGLSKRSGAARFTATPSCDFAYTRHAARSAAADLPHQSAELIVGQPNLGSSRRFQHRLDRPASTGRQLLQPLLKIASWALCFRSILIQLSPLGHRAKVRVPARCGPTRRRRAGHRAAWHGSKGAARCSGQSARASSPPGDGHSGRQQHRCVRVPQRMHDAGSHERGVDRARDQGTRPGRPRTEVDAEKLFVFQTKGFNAAEMARRLKVSRQIVIRRLVARPR
jgi:hypothetical protein